MCSDARAPRAILAGLIGLSILGCARESGGPQDGAVNRSYCVNSLDCVGKAGTTICDRQTGACVACVTVADCPASNDCTAHRCVPYVPCTDAAGCTSGVCDTAQGRCVECVTDDDCGAERRCAANLCRPACSSDNACTSLGLLCDSAAGYCVRCLSHQDCAAGEYCAQGSCKPDECQAGQLACIGGALAGCTPVGDGFGTPQPCAAGSCIITSAGPACELGGDDGGTPGSDGGAADSAVPGACNTAATDHGCAVIPRFPVPSAGQVLDGLGDEFAAVRPVSFTAMDAPFREGRSNGDAPPVKTFPEQITFRAAWSPEAFHMHLRVTDPSIHVGGAGSLWDGDAVDFMLASSDSFSFGGSAWCAANAIQFRIAPSTPPATEIAASGNGTGTVPAEWFAVRVLPSEAYEIELRVPWPGGVAPSGAAARIGFHLGVSIQDQDTGGRELWVTLPVDAALSPSGGCAGMPKEEAWCDGQAWCRPTLSEQSCP